MKHINHSRRPTLPYLAPDKAYFDTLGASIRTKIALRFSPTQEEHLDLPKSKGQKPVLLIEQQHVKLPYEVDTSYFHTLPNEVRAQIQKRFSISSPSLWLLVRPYWKVALLLPFVLGGLLLCVLLVQNGLREQSQKEAEADVRRELRHIDPLALEAHLNTYEPYHNSLEGQDFVSVSGSTDNLYENAVTVLLNDF